MHGDELQNVAIHLDWTKQKIAMTYRTRVFYFYEREVWWASLGQNIGFEENGTHRVLRSVLRKLDFFG